MRTVFFAVLLSLAGTLACVQWSEAQQVNRPVTGAAKKGGGSGSAAGTGTVAQQPYAGMEQREIAALSEQEIADLKAGRGMGIALPAELNGYPGPMHTLELADRLRLTTTQKTEVQTILDWMKSQAEAAGKSVIEAETALNAAFKTRKIDKAELTRLLKAAEAGRAELRNVHLAAHLETAVVLTDYQRGVYDAARGYSGATAAAGKAGRGSGSGSAGGSGSGSGSSSAATASGGMCGASGGCCGGGATASGTGMSCRPSRGNGAN